MTLKDEMFSDIENIFNDTDDFAEKHLFDETEVICTVDNFTLEENKLKSADGTYTGTILIHIASSQLPGKPAYGARIGFDGKYYFVKEVIENYGMYSITLDINKEK